MTGFAAHTRRCDHLNITCKIKSVNHRYTDVDIALPLSDLELESEILRLVKSQIKRGRITVIFEITKGNMVKDYHLDRTLLSKVKKTLKTARKELGDELQDFPLAQIFQFDVLINPVYHEIKSLHQEIITLLKDTLIRFKKNRQKEGRVLERDFQTRIKKIKRSLKEIKKHRKDHVNRMDKIFEKKLKQFNDDLSNTAKQIINFELSIIADKCDITEELVRADYHLNNFLNELKLSEPGSGKKLEFISQEILREVNTISSKSPNLIIRTGVISIKEELERIRQQVKNIE